MLLSMELFNLLFNIKKADRRMIFFGWQMLMAAILGLSILLLEVPGDTELVGTSLVLGAFALLLLAIVINITSVVRRLNDLAIKRWVAFPLLAWLYVFQDLETALYSFPVVGFIIATFLIFTPSRPVNDTNNESDLKQFFTWDGVMGRLEFAGYMGLQIVLWAAGAVLISSIPEGESGSTMLWTATIAMWVIAIWLNVVASLRRLSDIGRSRWFCLLKAIPPVTYIFDLALLFVPSEVQFLTENPEWRKKQAYV